MEGRYLRKKGREKETGKIKEGETKFGKKEREIEEEEMINPRGKQ